MEIDIKTLLDELVGKQCEGADNPYGSILRLDIGPLGIRAGEMPGTKIHGWRHLTIKSPWRIASNNGVLCDWNDDGGAGGVLMKRIAPLVGETVLNVAAAPPGWDLRIGFSSNLGLFVFSDSNNDRDDAWFILGTDGLTMSVGPEREGVGGVKIKRLPDSRSAHG